MATKNWYQLSERTTQFQQKGQEGKTDRRGKDYCRKDNNDDEARLDDDLTFSSRAGAA